MPGMSTRYPEVGTLLGCPERQLCWGVTAGYFSSANLVVVAVECIRLHSFSYVLGQARSLQGGGRKGSVDVVVQSRYADAGCVQQQSQDGDHLLDNIPSSQRLTCLTGQVLV